MRYLFVLFLLSLSIAQAAKVKLPVSFRADFTQKITSVKKKTINYSGRVLLNSSGRLKWIYKKPTQKEVCSDKKIFIVVDHDLEQVSFYKIDKALNLASIIKNARHYKGRLYTAKFADVTYTFSIDKKGRIDQLAYKDDLDNIVNIHFLNIKYSNKPNPISKMQCPYPIDYDIIGREPDDQY